MMFIIVCENDIMGLVLVQNMEENIEYRFILMVHAAVRVEE